MIDYVKIKVKAGKGGRGHVSFRRLKGKPYGPPEGGDGGDGGDVFIKASGSLSTLIPYRFKKDFKSSDGASGGKSQSKGAKGADLILEVPCGTLVKDEDEREISDLVRLGEKVLIAKGGGGGKGNAHVKMSDVTLRHAQGDAEQSRSIRSKMSDVGQKSYVKDYSYLKKAEEGKEGEEASLTLELKLLADVGLVGLPNAGKSTLLSKLTAAHPKIASYPFTTIEPNLGVMHHKGKELVMADIPGLIEGASKGRGLGDQFLRHVERTKVLAHLVSVESTDPVADLKTVDRELKQYSEQLRRKPQIYILTKIDIVDLEDFKNKVSQFKKKKIKEMPISSVTGDGLDELKDAIISTL